MSKIKLNAFIAIGTMLFLFSCSKESINNEIEEPSQITSSSLESIAKNCGGVDFNFQSAIFATVCGNRKAIRAIPAGALGAKNNNSVAKRIIIKNGSNNNAVWHNQVLQPGESFHRIFNNPGGPLEMIFFVRNP